LSFNEFIYLGDRVDRKGALTGGYLDVRRRRLEAAANLKKWRKEYHDLDDRAKDVKNEIAHILYVQNNA